MLVFRLLCILFCSSSSSPIMRKPTEVYCRWTRRQKNSPSSTFRPLMDTQWSTWWVPRSLLPRSVVESPIGLRSALRCQPNTTGHTHLGLVFFRAVLLKYTRTRVSDLALYSLRQTKISSAFSPVVCHQFYARLDLTKIGNEYPLHRTSNRRLEFSSRWSKGIRVAMSLLASTP